MKRHTLNILTAISHVSKMKRITYLMANLSTRYLGLSNISKLPKNKSKRDILLTTSYAYNLILLLYVFLFKRFRKLLFISKYLKWLILFIYYLIGIFNRYRVGHIHFWVALQSFALYRNEKWHKIFITILIVVLSFTRSCSLYVFNY